MNFNLQITGDSAAELVQTLQAFASATTIKQPEAKQEPIKESPVTEDEPVVYGKPAAKPRAKVAPKAEPTPEPEAQQATEAQPEEAPAQEYTIEEVRAAVHKQATAGKREEIKSLLNSFEVQRVTDLPADKFSKFMLELNAV